MLPRSTASGSFLAKSCLGLVLFLLGAAFASADELILTLIPPSGPVRPGSAVIVELLAVNPGDLPVSFNPPSGLQAQVVQPGQSWPIALQALNGHGTTVPPGGFARRKYAVQLPPAVSGRLILEIAAGVTGPLRGVIAVSTAEGPPVAGGSPTFAPNVVSSLGGQTAVSQLSRSFIDHFSAFDPMYFVYGIKAPAAKFEFSLKYRLFSFGDAAADPTASTVQFGYTQRSLWDASASSSPFYDTSYMPSFFYQFLAPAPNPSSDSWLPTWLGVASGYQHESNGQGGTLSRSINSLYVRSGLLIGRADRWHGLVVVRVFDYIGGISNNPQIKDYRGYGDWGVTLADGAGPSLSYTGWAGKDGNHRTSQFDLNIPVKIKSVDFATYFLVQYFNGYGESLRAYQAYTDTVRVGISLVR